MAARVESIHPLQIMLSSLTSLLGGLELLTEVITAGVLLMALDKVAAAIRLTYKTGHAIGTIWYRYGVPAVLWIADHISWIWSQIEWQQVRSDVAAMLRILIAGVITAVITAHQLLIKTSAVMGRWYASRVASPEPERAPDHTLVAPPSINPLSVIADELSELTGKELRLITGNRRKIAKRQLIAAFISA